MKYELNNVHQIHSAVNIWKGFLITFCIPRKAMTNIIGYTIIAIAGNGSQNTLEYGLDRTVVQEKLLFKSQNELTLHLSTACSIL